MKKLPLGIQSIDKILAKNDYVYVDKTGFIKQLIDAGSPHYFMSRPRRFGKSLFVSTLEEVFKGNKELFKGLDIYNSDYQWTSHPVLHLDFGRIPNRTPAEFESALKRKFQHLAAEHGVSVETPTVEEGIEDLVKKMAVKGKVVVLVDEYDKPIIDKLNNLDAARGNRELLKSMYSTLKGLDAHIKFTFITGVSKFSQVSLFSGPNYLTDITMDEDYACMLGYTENEIKHYFAEHSQYIVDRRVAARHEVTTEEVLDELRVWYNGYRFSKAPDSVYNPFSTLNFMKLGLPKSYWYSTGTPSFLIDQVKKHPQAIVPLSGATALESTLSDISNFNRINLTALMFQTGYLTITGYDREQDFYHLDFPNTEVRQAFFNSLLEDFAEMDPTGVAKSAQKIQEALNNFDLKTVVSIMNAHFGKIAYHLFSKSQEGFYHAVFLTFLERSGIKTTAEVATNVGRIDLVADLPKAICIFELKLDKTADIAFDQAEAKKYKERYSHATKDILVIGINFSSETRNISEWKAKQFSPQGEELREL